MRAIYRVTRTEQEVLVQYLANPDTAGNALWVTFARLKPSDIIDRQHPDAPIAISDATDAELLEAIL